MRAAECPGYTYSAVHSRLSPPVKPENHLPGFFGCLRVAEEIEVGVADGSLVGQPGKVDYFFPVVAAEHDDGNVLHTAGLAESQGIEEFIECTDAAGKDGTIKHVTSGLNPQGCHVRSFKAPSSEELDHDYLWRISRQLPQRGTIGVFNRSHYEEVIVAKVHDLPMKQQLPKDRLTKNLWKERYRQINDYEKYLHENGIVMIKIFLHLSKDEQKKRILTRIDDPAKNWKFSAGDLDERKHWDEYQRVFEEMIQNTATEYAPWYVVPADRKWFARTLVSEILLQTLRKIDPQYPSLPEDQMELLSHYREVLEND